MGDSIVIPPSEPAVQIAETQAILDRLSESSKTGDQRHKELCEAIAECQLRLERIQTEVTTLLTESSKSQQTVDPRLEQVIQQLTELQNQVSGLPERLMRETSAMQPEPSRSSPSTPPVVEVVESSAPIPGSQEVPEVPEPAGPPRRKRLVRI